MIREQWKKIGIDLVVQEVRASLAIQRTAAQRAALAAWNNDGSEHLFTFHSTSSLRLIAVVATSGRSMQMVPVRRDARGKSRPRG